MSDIGWRADGIARAKAAGGIELEVYRKPGFLAGIGVRRSEASAHAQGWETAADPDPEEWEDQRKP